MIKIYKSPGLNLYGQVTESPMPGQITLELYQELPTAAHPRKQRILQITDRPESIWAIGAWITAQ